MALLSAITFAAHFMVPRLNTVQTHTRLSSRLMSKVSRLDCEQEPRVRHQETWPETSRRVGVRWCKDLSERLSLSMIDRCMMYVNISIYMHNMYAYNYTTYIYIYQSLYFKTSDTILIILIIYVII